MAQLEIDLKVGKALIDLLEDMKLRPMREEHQRLSALVHKLDEELHERITKLAERDGRDIMASRRAYMDSVIERLRALEGTGHGTASPAHVNVVQLQNAIGDVAENHRNRLGDLDREVGQIVVKYDTWCNEISARIDAIGARVENLWAERDNLIRSHGASLINGKIERFGPPPGVPMPVNINGDIRMRTVSEERPGVMAVQLEPEDVAQPGRAFVDDPTTRSIERITEQNLQLRRDRDEARQLASVAADKLNEEKNKRARVEGQRDIALEGTDRLNVEITQLNRKLEVSDGALALANKEWNALREAVNPVLPKDLRDQSLVDAVPALIKRLHGMLAKDAREQVEREDAIASHGDETRKQLDVTTLKLENMVSACADQAIQIMELRTQVRDMQQAHAGELARYRSNRDRDFAEGSEQNKRLIADNQVMRVENANLRDKLKATEDRATRAEVSCTGYRERMNEIEATLARKDALLQGVTDSAAQVPTLREQLGDAKASLTRMEPLVATVERWSHSRGLGVDLGYTGVAQSAAAGADAGLLEAYTEYQEKCAEADPGDDEQGMPF